MQAAELLSGRLNLSACRVPGHPLRGTLVLVIGKLGRLCDERASPAFSLSLIFKNLASNDGHKRLITRYLA